MTREELVAALENATAASQELDEEIMALRAGVIREVQNGRSVYHVGTRWVSVGEVPSFTASIDAALTLVPAEWNVSHAYWGRGECSSFTLGDGGANRHWVEGRSHSATPSIALCIAALKARPE